MSQGPRPQSRLTSVARGYSFVAARVRESAAGPRRMRIGRLGSVSVMAMFHQLTGSLVRSGLPTTQQQLVNERIALFAQMNTGRSHKMPMT